MVLRGGERVLQSVEAVFPAWARCGAGNAKEAAMVLTAVVCGAAAAFILALGALEPVVFRPKPTDEVLYNPHMGFQTFQHFNGDPLFEGKKWTEVGPEEFGPKPESLENKDHPYTTVSYCRWYWDQIEPKEGEFRWDIIDGALKAARERGQTLAIRVMCFDSHGVNNVPQWLRDMGLPGADYAGKRGNAYWVPDYTNPLYIKHWTRINAELAKRYDGHPDLETVDCASIGPWGEWDTRPNDPPRWAKAALIDCYTKNFKKTPLLMQFDDPWSMEYGVTHGTGWRADCLGDMRVLSGSQWCHMFDAYPEGIIYGKAVDTWKTRPVVFEVCGVMGNWHEHGWDSDYIFEEATKKWHMSQFNTKSSAVAEDQWPAVYRCLKKMGYRYGLRKFAVAPAVRRGTMMRFHTWWENTGCAPIYRRYDVALQFRSPDAEVAVVTDADITKWLPGDIVYDSGVLVPADLPTGRYMLRIGIVHPQTREPRIQMPIEGLGEGGWYDLGEIKIVDTGEEVPEYVMPGTP